MSANVRKRFNIPGHSNIRISNIPSGDDMSGVSQGLNHLNGRGIQLLPESACTGGLDFGQRGSYRVLLPVNKQATTRLWHLHFSSSVTAAVTASINAGPNVFGTIPGKLFVNETVSNQHSQAKHVNAQVDVAAKDTDTTHFLTRISCFESPRVELDTLNNEDNAVQEISLQYRQPIYDSGQNQDRSVGGIVKALSGAMMVPRKCHYGWFAPYEIDGATDTTYVKSIGGAGTFLPVINTPIRIWPRRLYNEPISELTVAWYAWHSTAATTEMRVQTGEETFTHRFSASTKPQWFSTSIYVPNDRVDQIQVSAACSAGNLYVSSFQIFEDSPTSLLIGESGFTGSSHYARHDDNTYLEGGTSMFRAVMFRVDQAPSYGGTVYLWYKGWRLYVSAAGTLAANVVDGGGNSILCSGSVTSADVGKVYLAAFYFDGDELVLYVNGIEAQMTPSVVSGFTGNSRRIVLGAFDDGLGNTIQHGFPFTIIGAAATDTTISIGMTPMEYFLKCKAAGDIQPFAGCQHLYSKKKTGQLGIDVISGIHMARTGSFVTEGPFGPHYF